MNAPQDLRRSTRLRRRPLRYAEVGTLTFPTESLWTMRWTMEFAREEFAKARQNKNMRIFHLGQALKTILDRPAATAYYPEWRTEVTTLIYKYEAELNERPSWAQTLSRAYWRQYPLLFSHPLWRDATV